MAKRKDVTITGVTTEYCDVESYNLPSGAPLLRPDVQLRASYSTVSGALLLDKSCVEAKTSQIWSTSLSNRLTKAAHTDCCHQQLADNQITTVVCGVFFLAASRRQKRSWENTRTFVVRLQRRAAACERPRWLISGLIGDFLSNQCIILAELVVDPY